MRQFWAWPLILGVAALFAIAPGGARAACTVPNQLTNGQTADASQVMGNFNSMLSCVNNAPSGSTNALQYNAGDGSFGAVGPLTNGQILIGSTGNAPAATTLTAGPGIIITNGPGSIMIAGGGAETPVTLVQSAFTRIVSGTSGAVNLTSSPNPGDLLVAVASGYGGPGATLGIPATFSNVFSNIGQIAADQAIIVGAHVVTSGDGTNWPGFSGNSGGATFGVFEFSGGHAVQASAVPGTPSGAAWSFFAGGSEDAYTFFILENDSINGYSGNSGLNLLFDGTNTVANHPSVIAAISAGTATTGVVNYTGTSFGSSLLTTITVAP
jgi:hypothetical protein